MAFYSQEVMTGITEQYGLQYENSQGCLLICRQEQDLKNYQLQLNLMTENGIGFKKIDPIEARKLEPALSEDQTFHSAVMFPSDAIANCRQFTLLAKQQASLLDYRIR